MAEAILRHRARAAGADGAIESASAGTRPFQLGGPAHPMTLSVLAAKGIDASGLSGRAIAAEDVESFDHILAVDRHVLRHLERLPFGRARIDLLLPYGGSGRLDVPDPFLEGGFDGVFDLLDDAIRGLLEELLSQRRARG
jgi:protein-tyrosine phosphatase